jgi:FMN-dependent NADH-azoreductase
MTEVEFVFAEGLAMGPAAKEQALAKVGLQADRLAQPAYAD